MKTLTTSIFAISLSGVAPLSAQEALWNGSNNAAIVTASSSDQPTNVGEISDGTSDPPPKPKPRLSFEEGDVVSTRTVDLGERQIKFQKVTPITLPSISQPVASVEESETTASETQHPESKQHQSVFLGATVYTSDQKGSHPRSLVRFWPTPGSQPISMWVNANFLWLTGFAHFETEEVYYSLLMAISSATQEDGQNLTMPAFPTDDVASIIIVEGEPTEEQLAPIRALVALYNSDKDRLKGAYIGRVEQAEEAARLVRENPPEKKNLVLKYWRLDEAGQAGTSPKPANIQ